MATNELAIFPGIINSAATGIGAVSPSSRSGLIDVPIGGNWLPTMDATLSEWYDARDLTDGAVASWASRYIADTITEATNQPTASSGVLTFDGTVNILSRTRAPSRFGSQTALPDGPGGDPGKGFTGTGMCLLPDNTWLIGDHGLNVSGSPNPYVSALVRTSFDFKTPLGAVTMAQFYPGIQSIQGVTLDTSDNTVWFCDYNGNAIRHGSLVLTATDFTYTPITSDQITGILYNPNGLAYRPDLDRLFVSQENVNTIQQLSCTNGSIAATNNVSLGTTDRDMLWNDATNKVLYYTAGTNGSQGQVFAWRYGAGLDSTTVWDLGSDVLAVEGMYLIGNKLYGTADEYFHPAGSLTNKAYVYDAPPALASVIDLWWAGTIPTAGAGGIADCIIVNGIPTAGVGFGAYALSTTAINLIANTLPASTTQQGILAASGLADMTQNHIYYARFDIGNHLLSLSQDGNTPITGAIPNCVTPLYNARGLRLAGANTGETSAASRFCNMTLKAWGLNVGLGSQDKIVGMLAWQPNINLVANLPAGHPYKHFSP
jgi:hypothetical protein